MPPAATSRHVTPSQQLSRGETVAPASRDAGQGEGRRGGGCVLAGPRAGARNAPRRPLNHGRQSPGAGPKSQCRDLRESGRSTAPLRPLHHATVKTRAAGGRPPRDPDPSAAHRAPRRALTHDASAPREHGNQEHGNNRKTNNKPPKTTVQAGPPRHRAASAAETTSRTAQHRGRQARHGMGCTACSDPTRAIQRNPALGRQPQPDARRWQARRNKNEQQQRA